MAPVAAPFSWTGLYVGVDAGYLWSSVSVFDPAAAAAGTPTTHPNSFTFGGHIGYLYQFNSPLVIGVEGDLSWLNGSATGVFPGVTTSGMIANTKWDASLRGILGYAFDTNLIYATGGASWINGNGCGFVTATPGTCVANTNYSVTESGWTVGGGFAHAFTQNIIARVEYLHADYGTKTLTASAFAGGSFNLGVTTDKFRAGLSWKF